MAEPRHILLVEDEPTLQRILGSVLSDAGHAVDTVATAEAALELLTDSSAPHVDLVLSDKNLPGMSGLELLHRVHALAPDDAPGAFVVVTGYPSRESALDVLAHGGDGYMVKPFRSLVHAIQELEGILQREPARARAAYLLASHVHDALTAQGKLSPDLQVAVILDDDALRARVEGRLRALGATPRDALALAKTTLPAALIAGRVEDLARFRASNQDAALLLVDGAASFQDIVALVQQGGGRLIDPVRIGGAP